MTTKQLALFEPPSFLIKVNIELMEMTAEKYGRIRTQLLDRIAEAFAVDPGILAPDLSRKLSAEFGYHVSLIPQTGDDGLQINE